MKTAPAARRMMLPRGRCLKRRPRKSPRRAGADGRVRPKRARRSEGFGRRERPYYEKSAAFGNQDAKKALERARCPYVIKDKRGNTVTNLCF